MRASDSTPEPKFASISCEVVHEQNRDGVVRPLIHGSDLTVVNAARVSHGRRVGWDEEDDEGNLFLGRSDARLSHRLALDGHSSPFHHPQITFRMKMPICVARQFYKHRAGVEINEISRRYVGDDQVPVVFYMPDTFRAQPPKGVKQGKGPDMDEQQYHRRFHQTRCRASLTSYLAAIEDGQCLEQARGYLNQWTMIECICTMSLASGARVCGLRQAPNAQHEIKLLADGIEAAFNKYFPVAWAALRGPTRDQMRIAEFERRARAFVELFEEYGPGYLGRYSRVSTALDELEELLEEED